MALVNASVLIPLAKIGRLELLRNGFKEVKVTKGIRAEAIGLSKPGATEIEKALQSWIKEEKEKIAPEQKKELAEKESVSEGDAELILTAKKKKEKILSNDYRLHAVAKTKGIETEWLTTLLLRLAKERKITKKEAKDTLLELVQAGMRLKVEVYAAIEKKIDEL